MRDRRGEKTYVYIDSKRDGAWRLLGREFYRCVSESYRGPSPLVMLCIGTDRATGDSLGPLVGARLSESTRGNVRVFGTLENPVHALNLGETLREIRAFYGAPYIFAIDASLGNAERIGYMRLEKGALKPGLCLNKDLPSVGDAHITGIVNFGGAMESLILQTTKLGSVIKMSEVISRGICFGLSKMADQSLI